MKKKNVITPKKNAYQTMEHIRRKRASKFAKIFNPCAIGFEAFKDYSADKNVSIFLAENVVVIRTDVYPEFGLLKMDKLVKVGKEMFQVVYKNQKEHIVKLMHLPSVS